MHDPDDAPNTWINPFDGEDREDFRDSENPSGGVSRRDLIKGAAVSLGAVALSRCAPATTSEGASPKTPRRTSAPSAVANKPKVYFTKALSSAALVQIYAKVTEGRPLPGKVAVKLHSGEPNGHHYPAPVLIKPLVQSLHGTIVECNTAYPGKRFKTADHKKVVRDHGFTAIAPVDIMDERGSIALPYPKGRRIKQNFVGASFAGYDSFLILSHFKGHQMGGFGGAIKNMSIGIASGEGKMWIHSAGTTRTLGSLKPFFSTKQEHFLESMAEAAGSVVDRLDTGKLVYINLMNHLSVDCDCNGHPAKPELPDIGILASLDPVALDQACVDLIYQADPTKSASLRKRIEAKKGLHTLAHAEAMGVGTRKYQLVTLG